jgi:hypothetical protein
MGVEFGDTPFDIGEAGTVSELDVTGSSVQRAVIEIDTTSDASQRARRTDSLFVKRLMSLGDMAPNFGANNPGMFALSDGITSHMINGLGIAAGDDDYLLIYYDPWGSRRSFLQEGNNVGGCAAIRRSDGSWAVPVWQFVSVLDSAMVFRPKDEKDGTAADAAAATK